MPGNFKEFFDIRKLTEEERGNIEFVLNSPAYNDYFRPRIQSVIDTMNAMWKDRSRDRQEDYSDDYLAGGVVFAEGLLKFFETIIHDTKMERIHGAMQNMTPEMVYEHKRRTGQIRPVVGANQSAEPRPVSPEEDY